MMAWIKTLFISQAKLWPGIKLALYTGVINTSLIQSSTTIINPVNSSPLIPMDCKPNERQQRPQNTAEVQQRNHSIYLSPPHHPPSKVDQGSMDLVPVHTVGSLRQLGTVEKLLGRQTEADIYSIINTYSMSAIRYRAWRIQCDQ